MSSEPMLPRDISTRDLVRRVIVTAEENAGRLDLQSTRIDQIDAKLACMITELSRLKLEDARRGGYIAGARMGAQMTLLALAAAVGSGATKLFEAFFK